MIELKDLGNFDMKYECNGMCCKDFREKASELYQDITDYMGKGRCVIKETKKKNGKTIKESYLGQIVRVEKKDYGIMMEIQKIIGEEKIAQGNKVLENNIYSKETKKLSFTKGLCAFQVFKSSIQLAIYTDNFSSLIEDIEFISFNYKEE